MALSLKEGEEALGASAGTKKRTSVQGESSLYAMVKRTTTGAYRGTADSATGHCSGGIPGMGGTSEPNRKARKSNVQQLWSDCSDHGRDDNGPEVA